MPAVIIFSNDENEVRDLAENVGVLLSRLVEHLHLEIAFQSTDYESVRLTVEDLSRPGLQLAGYLEHFEPLRLQVMGNAEVSYLSGLSKEDRLDSYDRIFAYKFPAMLVARNLPVDEECLQMAVKHNITVLRSQEATGKVINGVISFLREALAPSITRHGVLIEVYGEGILLLGESGGGKSETAIELVKRGHRLIADDAVEIKKISDKTLIGSAPESIRHYVELRGIGIIDIRRIFGMGAIKHSEKIDLIINLEFWSPEKDYNRFGTANEYMNIMGVEVPKYTIPVKPGRNLAIILEIAAMNHRQKKMGYNTAKELEESIMASILAAEANQ